MATPSKTRPPSCHWGALAALALAAVLAPRPAAADEPLRWSRDVPGDSKPIFLASDDVTTWSDQGRRTFLLKGKVWITQGGLVNVYAQDAVVLVDESAKSRTGIYKLEIYGEGNVQLEEGIKVTRAATALLELNTRGEVRLKSTNGKVNQAAAPGDPLLQRAQAARAAPPAPQAQPAADPAPPPAQATPPPVAFPTASPTPIPNAPPAPPAFPRLPVFPGPAARPVPPDRLPPIPGQPLLHSDAGESSTSNKVASVTPGDNPIQLTGGQWVPQTEAGAAATPQLPSPPGPPQPPPVAGPSGIPPLAPVAPRTGPAGQTQPPPAGAQQPVPGLSGGSGPRQITVRPRSSAQDLEFRSFPQPNGETAFVISSGVILNVSGGGDGKGAIDIEADRMVFWTKGDSTRALNELQSGQAGPQTDRSLEFYFSGNVQVRSQGQKESRTLNADEVYYDVNRHVAVAYQADLELQEPGLVNPLHLKAPQLLQLDENLFEAKTADVFSSELPANPGLKLSVSTASVEIKKVVKTNIFGKPFVNIQTGEQVTETQQYFKGKNLVVRLEGVPVWYFPYVQGDSEDPLGPLQNFNFGYNRIFGAQFFTTWNMYDLIGTTSIPGTRWRLDLDYMTARGPAAGTVFDFAGRDLFGIPNRYQGQFKLYGIYDSASYDILGGGRGQQILIAPNDYVPVFKLNTRGRVYGALNMQDLDDGFTVQAKLSALSDKNFLEQFYAPEFQNGLNQETYAYVKQQQDYWAWTALVEPRLRPFVTETERLPEVGGYLLGLKFLDDLVTYNARADAGFFRLLTTDQAPFAYLPTDQRVNTGRLDLIQDVSVPLQAGPFKVVPYGVFDVTGYSQDLAGQPIGRIYGGGGVRASVPLSHLYPTVSSEFFNVNGIFHKIVFSGNYYNAQSGVSLYQLPQLDRVNDDASDQALRDLRYQQALINPANATTLTTSPIYNPQVYALRRLDLTPIDTRDTIQVFQLGARQRLQTKRGYPGQQHIIDWMTLDLTASIFPAPSHDGFAPSYGFFEYDWVWNIGDRTALVSTGFFEPFDNAPDMFTFGAHFNRPDRTTVYVGYREIDPLNSKAVIGSLTYAFSPKYALTASTLYDFGVHNQVNSLMLTRIGTDVQLSLGFSYNSILNNFNFSFMLMPNLIASKFGPGGLGTAGSFMGTTAPGR